MALKTDYKDDVLNTSKNDKRKYRIINNSDGTISLEDVTVYTQTGSSFGASDVNAITREINTQNSKLAPSELLTWGTAGGVRVRGKYNGTMITFFVSGALTAALPAWGTLNLATEASLKPAVDVTARASGDLYVVAKTDGKIVLYNGSSTAIAANSGREVNATLTYVI